jgi:WS/DGAT/MGAT family acyltransferase
VRAVADRLSTLDASFLYVEEPTTPMHVGSVGVFEAPKGGFDHDRLVDLISERIAFVPRYRQRVRDVPAHLANPVWVDDEHFDIGYHVRRSALPRPGNDEQLFELVARVHSRPLDRTRPLWEMYLVEGLSGQRFAVITKTHHAMVDGIGAVDIGQVILDSSREASRARSRKRSAAVVWQPEPEPSWVELIAGAVSDTARRPTAAIDTVRGGLSEVRSAAGRLAGVAGGLFAAGVTAARPAPGSPLNVVIGAQRRFASVTTDLDDYRRIRKAHGGTVNDVVLAAVAGALRTWLLTRGESVSTSTIVRAMVPVSVQDEDESGPTSAVMSRVSSYLVDLPVGEPSPVMRLHQVSYRMKAHKETGKAVGAEALVGLAGFAPPTLHALGARAASSMSKRWFNLVVTNVPGPQQPLYADGARMLATFPVVPLAKTQAVSIGLTSYDGKVFYGLNADRDAMPDIDVLAQCIVDAVAELLATVR